jgi:SpoVK/Ycf46/Vps4 family AAA+-type ATPase
LQDSPDLIASATEGFVGRDLHIISQRVLHSALNRQLDLGESNDIAGGHRKLFASDRDFQNALEDYVPLALQGISLQVFCDFLCCISIC